MENRRVTFARLVYWAGLLAGCAAGAMGIFVEERHPGVFMAGAGWAALNVVLIISDTKGKCDEERMAFLVRRLPGLRFCLHAGVILSVAAGITSGWVSPPEGPHSVMMTLYAVGIIPSLWVAGIITWGVAREVRAATKGDGDEN